MKTVLLMILGAASLAAAPASQPSTRPAVTPARRAVIRQYLLTNEKAKTVEAKKYEKSVAEAQNIYTIWSAAKIDHSKGPDSSGGDGKGGTYFGSEAGKENAVAPIRKSLEDAKARLAKFLASPYMPPLVAPLSVGQVGTSPVDLATVLKTMPTHDVLVQSGEAFYLLKNLPARPADGEMVKIEQLAAVVESRNVPVNGKSTQAWVLDLFDPADAVTPKPATQQAGTNLPAK